MRELSYQNNSFNRSAILAVLFHVFLILIIWGLKLVGALSFFDSPKNDNKLMIIESAVRVDVVSMPKFTVSELKKMKIPAAKAEPKVEIAKPETASNETSKVEFKKVAPKVNLGSLLANISRKNIPKSKKVKSKKKKFDRNKLKALVLEGNKISKGSSTVGKQIDKSLEAFVEYTQALSDRVRNEWKLPSYLMDRDLRCRIRIYLAANGNLIKAQVYESSGEAEYDNKSLDAIKRAAPFNRPDGTILPRISAGDIILGFPL